MMRKRLYCILPNIEHCNILVSQLKKMGISQKDIYVVDREDISLEELHKLTKLQKTELIHGIRLGINIGGIAGLLGGLLAVFFPPGGVAVAASEVILLTTTLTGAFFGGLVSALIAADIPNHTLEEFQNALVNGYILLIVKVPSRQFDERVALIRTSYPEVGLVTI